MRHRHALNMVTRDTRSKFDQDGILQHPKHYHFDSMSLRTGLPFFSIFIAIIIYMIQFILSVPTVTAVLGVKRIPNLAFQRSRQLLTRQQRSNNHAHYYCSFRERDRYTHHSTNSKRRFSANNDSSETKEPKQYSSSVQTDHGLESVEKVINKIANRSRSWGRLRPLVEMAIEPPQDKNNNNNLQNNNYFNMDSSTAKQHSKSIVDIGCDHGLLAVGLAVSGQFTNVIGIDVSLDALQDGAYKLYDTIVQRQIKKNNNLLQQSSDAAANNNRIQDDDNKLLRLSGTDIEFRHGNGLHGLRSGESADTICIAGMGTNTMIDILTEESNGNDSLSPFKLHQHNCTQLILQPTNSKPKDLIVLYRTISNSLGYQLADERIVYVSKRWYLSSSFIRPYGSTEAQLMALPGSILATRTDPSDATYEIFQKWVTHHDQWIRSGHEKTRLPISADEIEWLQSFRPILKQ